MRLSWLPFAVTCVFWIQVSCVTRRDEGLDYYGHACSRENYTTNSTYQKSLNTLLHSFPLNNDMNYGFYNVSVGEGDDQVNAIALCRGEINQTTCFRCLNFSKNNLPVRCPSAKEAIVWYDNCMLRYSNRSIFHSMEALPNIFLFDVSATASEATWFRQGLVAGLYSSVYQASSGESHKKFGAANTFADKDTRIYSLVQCTPDLTELQCSNCLNKSIMLIPSLVSPRDGGRISAPSCSLRYEVSQFYKSQPPSPSPSPAPPRVFTSTHRHIPKTTAIDASTLRSVALLIGICSLILLMRRLILLMRRKAKLRRKGHQIFLLTDAHDIKSLESLQFDFETLKVATNNFNNDNKLGQGGFGSVYKGKLVEGKEIAVKRLASHSGQGDLEFRNEVILLAKLQHRKLVRLLGYCLKGNERLLIYEFVPNSSLDHFLFDSVKRVCLDWEVRYVIINGIAKGLLYLHEDSRLRVIHRDLKAGNILLDEEMCPKIADFGLARMFNMNQTQASTTRIVGTYGYMAPEYAMHGKFSVKSDVYSFAILLLEIISGQKNSRFSIEDTTHELTSFAWDNWKAGTPSNIIDPMILKGHNRDILRSIHIGLLCVQDSVSARPTMASVVFMLGNASLALPVPSKPAIFTSVELEMATTSSLRGEVCTTSVNQVSVSDDFPR